MNRSQELGLNHSSLLAAGRTSEVYAFRPDKVIKLFRKDWPKELAEHEARVTRLIQTAGLPAPKVGNLLKFNGRLGLEYERIYGNTLLDKVKQKPWTLATVLDKSAKLQTEIHHQSVSGLPLTTERLIVNIEKAKQLTEKQREKSIALLKSLPIRKNLNHGDFHIGNILDDGKRFVVIDWDDVSIGNRLADISRTALLLTIVNLPSDSNRFFRSVIEIGRSLLNPSQIYLSSYSKYYPFDPNEYKKWFVVNAASRLSEEVPGETERLLKIVSEL